MEERCENCRYFNSCAVSSKHITPKVRCPQYKIKRNGMFKFLKGLFIKKVVEKEPETFKIIIRHNTPAGIELCKEIKLDCFGDTLSIYNNDDFKSWERRCPIIKIDYKKDKFIIDTFSSNYIKKFKLDNKEINDKNKILSKKKYRATVKEINRKIKLKKK